MSRRSIRRISAAKPAGTPGSAPRRSTVSLPLNAPFSSAPVISSSTSVVPFQTRRARTFCRSIPARCRESTASEPSTRRSRSQSGAGARPNPRGARNQTAIALERRHQQTLEFRGIQTRERDANPVRPRGARFVVVIGLRREIADARVNFFERHARTVEWRLAPIAHEAAQRSRVAEFQRLPVEMRPTIRPPNPARAGTAVCLSRRPIAPARASAPPPARPAIASPATAMESVAIAEVERSGVRIIFGFDARQIIRR